MSIMNTQTIQLQKSVVRGIVLATAIFFLWSTAAQASIVVEGDRAFTDEVNNCFATYGDTPGIVGDVIKELQNSAFEHKIIDSPDWTNAPNDVDEATGGSGSGSVTRVNPEKLKDYVSRLESLKNKDFCTALLHEMWHAVDNNRGTRTPHDHKIDGAKETEIEATLFQNFIHAIRGVPPRTLYGGIDISGHVVIGHGDEIHEAEAEESEPEESTETEVGTEMSFAHVKPGEYSEVYLTVATTPGVTIDVTLKGPGVDGEPSQSQNADGAGVAKFTWKIVSYGVYTIEGASAGAPFTDSVSVQ